jgi:RNA polymerase sigma-70 factor (ECF subfamily)
MNESKAKTPAGPREDEFFGLFTRYQRRIYAFIRSMVSNSSDADDLFQETSMRLWDQRAKYVSGSDFVAWAFTIARYQVATYRKANARQKLQYSDQFLDVVARKMEEENAEERQLALAQCMDKLSPRNVQILLAFYAPGAAARQVATQFGGSVDAVYQTISRVRRILHECIQQSLKGPQRP